MAISYDVTPRITCPPCRDFGHGAAVPQRRLLEYKPIYMCETHHDAWEIADVRDRARDAVRARRSKGGQSS